MTRDLGIFFNEKSTSFQGGRFEEVAHLISQIFFNCYAGTAMATHKNLVPIAENS